MARRIDARQRMRDDPDRPQTGIHRCPVSLDIDSVGQPADDHRVGNQRGQLPDQALAKHRPVRSHAPRADHRQPAGRVQIGSAAHVDHMRIIGALLEPAGIFRRARIDRPDPVPLDESELPFRRPVILAATDTPRQLGFQSGSEHDLLLRRGEQPLGRAEALDQMNGRTASYLRVHRKGYVVDSHFRKRFSRSGAAPGRRPLRKDRKLSARTYSRAGEIKSPDNTVPATAIRPERGRGPGTNTHSISLARLFNASVEQLLRMFFGHEACSHSDRPRTFEYGIGPSPARTRPLGKGRKCP